MTELSDAIGVGIYSFAYPFGMIDPVVGDHISAYGYSNAVGLGTIIIPIHWVKFFTLAGWKCATIMMRLHSPAYFPGRQYQLHLLSKDF